MTTYRQWWASYFFLYNVFQLPNRTPPPTPVQASQARWVGVRVHVILLGIVGYVFYGNCTEAVLRKLTKVLMKVRAQMNPDF
jgi:hypothetical protein